MLFAQDAEYLAQTFTQVAGPDQDVVGAEFEGCDFVDCDFTQSVFKGCKFIECTFTRCNLSVVQLPQSQFNAVSFVECKLIGVDWTRAAWPSLVFAAPLTFKQCLLNDSSFFGLAMDELVMEDCKAHELDLRDGSFRRASFTYTDFTNALFGKTDLSQADFTEAENYDIDVLDNRLDGATFTRFEAVRLLHGLGIELVD